jgi:hypothetical protein
LGAGRSDLSGGALRPLKATRQQQKRTKSDTQPELSQDNAPIDLTMLEVI